MFLYYIFVLIFTFGLDISLLKLFVYSLNWQIPYTLYTIILNIINNIILDIFLFNKAILSFKLIIKSGKYIY